MLRSPLQVRPASPVSQLPKSGVKTPETANSSAQNSSTEVSPELRGREGGMHEGPSLLFAEHALDALPPVARRDDEASEKHVLSIEEFVDSIAQDQNLSYTDCISAILDRYAHTDEFEHANDLFDEKYSHDKLEQDRLKIEHRPFTEEELKKNDEEIKRLFKIIKRNGIDKPWFSYDIKKLYFSVNIR